MADDPARVDLNLLKGFVALVDEWSTRAIARRLCLIRLWEDFGGAVFGRSGDEREPPPYALDGMVPAGRPRPEVGFPR